MPSETPRDSPTQQEPPKDKDFLLGFPTIQIIGMTERWCKAHKEQYSPWYFNNEPGARFNLSGSYGTCYMASTPETAVREMIGPDFIRHNEVLPELLENYVVSTMYIPETFNAAELCSDDAFNYRISSELTASTPYEITRQWAQKFFETGYKGIHYYPRFSNTRSTYALAMFGVFGEANFEYRKLQNATDYLQTIGIRQLNNSTDGYTVLDEFGIND